MRQRVACGSVAASNLLGHSVHAPVHALRPGGTHYYQFRALGKHSRVGRTRDDHEVVNDCSGSGGAAPFVKRRAAAYQAWYEHLPIRAGSALEPQIHRRRRWGTLLTSPCSTCASTGPRKTSPTARSSVPPKNDGC